MPLGEIDGQRIDQFLPLSLVRARLATRYTLEDLDDRTGGPARYVRVKETGGTLGFITPMTHNFCESCNRVRLTCTGQLFMCLGQEDAADLRAPVRASESDERSPAGHRRRDRPQAQGARLHHRPAPRPPRAEPSYERDRRLRPVPCSTRLIDSRLSRISSQTSGCILVNASMLRANLTIACRLCRAGMSPAKQASPAEAGDPRSPSKAPIRPSTSSTPTTSCRASRSISSRASARP